MCSFPQSIPLVVVAQYLCHLFSCLNTVQRQLWGFAASIPFLLYIEIISSFLLSFQMSHQPHFLLQGRKWPKQQWVFSLKCFQTRFFTFLECNLSYHSQSRHAICIRPSISLLQVNHKSVSVTLDGIDHQYRSRVLLFHQEEVKRVFAFVVVLPRND